MYQTNDICLFAILYSFVAKKSRHTAAAPGPALFAPLDIANLLENSAVY